MRCDIPISAHFIQSVVLPVILVTDDSKG